MDYLKCVESFVRTVTCGSFTAAAEELGITPAMVGNMCASWKPERVAS
jgi:DNA-binding transcriptional LysR family regulator